MSGRTFQLGNDLTCLRRRRCLEFASRQEQFFSSHSIQFRALPANPVFLPRAAKEAQGVAQQQEANLIQALTSFIPHHRRIFASNDQKTWGAKKQKQKKPKMSAFQKAANANRGRKEATAAFFLLNDSVGLSKVSK
jgi:hypothetical protein